jgi:hypothetical protein
VNGGKCGFAFGKVWFLPDVYRPVHLETSCVIPRGKLILVPGANITDAASRKALEQRAHLRRHFIVGSEITLDGRSLGPGRWVSTPVFNANLPLHNVFNAPPGLWNNFTNGYYAILTPLSPGRHNVTTRQLFNDPREEYAYTYHLTIR